MKKLEKEEKELDMGISSRACLKNILSCSF